MSEPITVTFDGEVFRPDTVPPLPPNSRWQIVPALLPQAGDQPPLSALEVMMSMNLDGPPDWSSNLDKYLYGHPEDPPAE